jgi:hypothetical protein
MTRRATPAGPAAQRHVLVTPSRHSCKPKQGDTTSQFRRPSLWHISNTTVWLPRMSTHTVSYSKQPVLDNSPEDAVPKGVDKQWQMWGDER